MIDLTVAGDRKAVLDEIKSEENYTRKREHQKRFDVFRHRQDRYIVERLNKEFDVGTVRMMRKILSINLVPEIIRQMSSVYKTAPEREFFAQNRELSEREVEQINNLYYYSKANKNLLSTNQFYNLHDQTFLMVLPDKKGKIKAKPVPPMHIDAIPDELDVESAKAFILNVWDKDLHKTAKDPATLSRETEDYRFNDRMNQRIADDSDRLALLERFVVWTREFHFTMDGKGEIVDEIVENPIQKLPFIDIAKEKDFQFFVRTGTSLVDFALDLGLILSDTSNTIRLQSYAQAVMTSEKPPTNLQVGPNSIIWLPIDPANPSIKPEFSFVSPSPDIQGSLEFIEMSLNLFLSSRGLDTSIISGKQEGQKYSSGIERMLAMIDRFEATKDDYDLFKGVEKELFYLLRDWSNVMQDVSDEEALIDELRIGVIGDDVKCSVKFFEPQMIQTEKEKEDSVLKLMEAGLLSRKEALMDLRGVDEEAARQILEELDQEIMRPIGDDGGEAR